MDRKITVGLVLILVSYLAAWGALIAQNSELEVEKKEIETEEESNSDIEYPIFLLSFFCSMWILGLSGMTLIYQGATNSKHPGIQHK
jgi:hypothetical protein